MSQTKPHADQIEMRRVPRPGLGRGMREGGPRPSLAQPASAAGRSPIDRHRYDRERLNFAVGHREAAIASDEGSGTSLTTCPAVTARYPPVPGNPFVKIPSLQAVAPSVIASTP